MRNIAMFSFFQDNILIISLQHLKAIKSNHKVIMITLQCYQ